MPAGRALALAAAGSALLAAASLAAVSAPGFDAWGWLVWGRELTGLELDTTGGPSWKPLPVIVIAPIAALDVAPELWLWLTRTCWLLSAALAALLAVRLSPARALAAVPGGAATVAAVAAGAIILLDDAFTPWLRQGAIGLSEPVLVTLALGAFAARVEDRQGLSLALLFACSLLRPEAWALFGLAAAQRVRAGAGPWGPTLAGLAIPLLWLVPDLIGSGDALTGAERAREGSGAPLGEAAEALGRLAAMPLAALWPAALLALWRGHGRGLRLRRELAVAAALWELAVIGLAALGYAGLPRFSLPAAAAVGVLGAAGLAQAALWARAPARRSRWRAVAPVAVAAALAALGAQGAWRAAELPADAREIGDRADRERAALAVARAGAGPATRSCSRVYVGDFLLAPAVAWELDRSLGAVVPLPEDRVESGVTLLETGERPAGGRLLAAGDGWRLRAVDCGVERRQGPSDVRLP